MSTAGYVKVAGGLLIDPELYKFCSEELLVDIPLTADRFWSAMADVCDLYTKRNTDLLVERSRLKKVHDDHWRRVKKRHGDSPFAPDLTEYEDLLRKEGYIVPEGAPFTITSTLIDPEIAVVPAPQLVVPGVNPRYSINAANSRWGSLFDALYGTDAIDGTPKPDGPFDTARGFRVTAIAKNHLDRHTPLRGASWSAVHRMWIEEGVTLTVESHAFAYPTEDAVKNVPATRTVLADASQLVGFAGPPENPTRVVLRHNGLHMELVLDRSTAVGKSDLFGLSDIIVEGALSAIIDGEDSSAAVDGPDKVRYYRTWLGLNRGDIECQFSKGDKTVTRTLEEDRVFSRPGGGSVRLAGRSVLMTRNVGLQMRTPAVVLPGGEWAYEGLIDSVVTIAASMHDLVKSSSPSPLAAVPHAGSGGCPVDDKVNSRTGSIYVVKPKMHGPFEVAFTNAVYCTIEAAYNLPPNTVKLGVMDEERRTSVNLQECIRACSARICFINTGFLDRTGDEIHTMMEAGPCMPRPQMKASRWLAAYEQRNVVIGISCGFMGRAQIGKGMWAMPHRMHQMMRDKIAHLRAGASCSWVPSPTAATLHALHYHEVDVREVQRRLGHSLPTPMRFLLSIPLMYSIRPKPTVDEINREVASCCQSILGYVVRWIDLGIGCSTVPDIDNVGLMEDRATLRISSQLLANWVHHGLVSKEAITGYLRQMAVVVDKQNTKERGYKPMAPGYGGAAFRAASQLIEQGVSSPSGYTEPLLHSWRLRLKRGDVDEPMKAKL